jgi:hypothetical protein
MNMEFIRKRLHEEFVPFAIRLTDGRKYEVPHTDFVLLAKNVVIIVDKDGYPVRMDPLHIVSLDDLPAQTAPTPPN